MTGYVAEGPSFTVSSWQTSPIGHGWLESQYWVQTPAPISTTHVRPSPQVAPPTWVAQLEPTTLLDTLGKQANWGVQIS